MVETFSPLGSQSQIPSTGERVSENAALNEIARKKDCTLPQILIAWGLKRGYVVLPKSSNKGHIETNFASVDLLKEEFQAINDVAKGRNFLFVNMKDVWPEEQKV